MAPADVAPFDDDVGVVPLSLDLDLPEADQSSVHRISARGLVQAGKVRRAELQPMPSRWHVLSPLDQV